MNARFLLLAKVIGLPIVLSLTLLACSSGDKELENPITPPKSGNQDKDAPADGASPALAVATVASLISVSDVMVREPTRFQKAMCSDGNIYDLDYDGSRFSLRAEPLSVCVLFADTKNLKPKGFCGDSHCDAMAVTECNEAERKDLAASFAKDQVVQRCWNIGAFAPLNFSVLVTRVGQSCQVQSLVKNAKGWKVLSSNDGTYESRKTATAEGQGCWWEAGNSYTYEGEWFAGEKKALPVMAFEKDGGLYALLKSTWTGAENYQLFRVDGDKMMEVESFAESFKDPLPEPVAAPPAPEAKKESEAKGKGKKAKKAQKSPKPQPVPVEEVTPPAEPQPELPNKDAPPTEEPTPEAGVNPLEGDQ